MPAGIGYAAGAAFKGTFGKGAQGMMIGASMGAAYGAVSDRQTVLGGALGWGMKGAMAGSAIGVANRFGKNLTAAARFNGARQVNLNIARDRRVSPSTIQSNRDPREGYWKNPRGRMDALKASIRQEYYAIRAFGNAAISSNNGVNKIKGMK